MTEYGFFVVERRECPECEGVGSYYDLMPNVPCPECEGFGFVQTEASLIDALVKLKVISPAHEEHLEALEIK